MERENEKQYHRIYMRLWRRNGKVDSVQLEKETQFENEHGRQRLPIIKIKINGNLRECIDCREMKDLSMFGKDRWKKDGISRRCKKCAVIRARKHYYLHPEVHRKQTRDFYQRNKEKLKNGERIRNRKRRLKILQIVSGLEKPVCKNCGCDDMRLLEINHINGGGIKEFRKRGSTNFYNDIEHGRRSIDDLEIRCRVCNALHFVKLKYGNIPITVIWNKKII